MAFLRLEHVKKYFPVPARPREVVKAVDDVDLTIFEGETLGLVGESGSGKTTLGRLILRLYQPDDGLILVNDENWTTLSNAQLRQRRHLIQVVFQDPFNSLDPRLTIAEILSEAFIARVGGPALSATEKWNLMTDGLKAVGLKESVLGRYPHEFSGGERQRIAIGRSLLVKPKLLILDEAVSSLDVLIQAQIIELLEHIQAQTGMAYLFITHNLKVVKKMCQRTAVMYNGKIVEWGQTTDLLSNPLHSYTQNLLSAAFSYQSTDDDPVYHFEQNSRLIDKGNGHFVIQ